MPPSVTSARVLSWLVCTIKSVPLTPMAARGVFRRKFSRASLAALPDMERAVPSSNLKVTRLLAAVFVS